tara:strand:- start:14872 stop:15147 length:276 start_codon:yes stop_codon:yes gene_type:complete
MMPIDFIDYIKKQKCIVCFRGPCDADHLHQIGMGRDRKKPDLIEHYSCVPLCRTHHIMRHSMTLKDFEDKFDVNVWKENHYYLSTYLKENL